MGTHTDDNAKEAWFWDLRRSVAVRASQRGLASEVLGPYTSRAEAERWQQTVDFRNETWDDADDEWNNAWRNDTLDGSSSE